MRESSNPSFGDDRSNDLACLAPRHRMKVISLQLEQMAHALAGDVEPVLVAEFILLANRLEKRLTVSGHSRAT